MIRVSLVFGTRPEAIKLSPLVLALRQDERFHTHVCVTGQHRQMLDQVLDAFDIRPDRDLEVMQADQTLASLTSRVVEQVYQYLGEFNPDVVVVQGDTTTAFGAALAAFYRKIPVGHVEAGLRTWNKLSPYPEEMNRLLTTRLADYHFAPTAWSAQNLAREGVPADRIFVTGNTVIDALRLAAARLSDTHSDIPGLPLAWGEEGRERYGPLGPRTRKIVLITGHRRENFGLGFESLCRAISDLAKKFPDVAFVYPVHLNPNVREPVFRLLGGQPNIQLIEPLGYLPFVALLSRATIVLTDSGGVQEEAPGLGKPVLVMRNTTERPEAVEAGTVRLVGTEVKRIVDEVSTLLTDDEAYTAMARAHNPYGDGRACMRITEALAASLSSPNS